MTKTKSKNVGFVITGEFVTAHARNLSTQDGNWEEGYRFLTDCIIGMDHEIAVSILNGEYKLVGKEGYGIENSIELVEEDEITKKVVKSRIAFLWCGIVRERPFHWRPYAYVSNFGPNDTSAADRYNNQRYFCGSIQVPPELPATRRKFDRWSKSRCCEYMNDPANDRVELVKIDGNELAVLFEKVPSPPLWLKPIPCHSSCWQEAAEIYQKECDLEERGHRQQFAEEKTEKDIKKAAEEINKEATRRLSGYDEDDDEEDVREGGVYTDSFLREQMMSQLSQLNIDSEDADGILDYYTGDVDESAPAPCDTQDFHNGWITRDGKFYGCKYHHHAIMARRIWEYIEKNTDDAVLNDPQLAGDNAGWIRISKSGMQYHMLCCKKPNAKQKATLEDWATWHNQDPNDLEILSK